MDREIIKKLKNILSEKEIEIEEIIEDEKELHKIKLNFHQLALVYIQFANQFIRDFEFEDNLEIKNIVEKNKKIRINIIKIINELNTATNFGKMEYMSELNNYVEKNYDEIVFFVDMCNEIYGELS